MTSARATRPALLALLVGVALVASPRAACGLSTSSDRLLDENGNTLVLRGANWFGFNNGATMVDGLWTPGNGFTYDFATIVYRWQLLGFNAIRLPFSMRDLYSGTAPYSKVSSCSLPSFASIAYSVADPQDNVPPGLASFPQPAAWPAHAPGTCNGYLPSDSTLNRFVWVAQYLARAGFYVIVDDHTEDPTVVNDRAAFVRNWADIVARISKDATAAKRLIVDILNEPDARGWGWDTMGGLYLSVMDAVYPVNSNVLFLVEGCGQGGINRANWGDGFQTKGITSAFSDPNPFFKALFAKAYFNQVALSPHVYGPSVSGANNYFGSGLWTRLTNSFGYLTTTGYTYNSVTKRFPIVIGEVGSKFSSAGDLQFLPDFQAYLLKTGAAAGYNHNAIPNIIWWSWNDNSGDTGGLIDSSWYNLIWVKVRYLNALGLTPWYKNGSGVSPSPSPSPSPATSPSPSPSSSPSPSLSPSPSSSSSLSPSPSPASSPSPSPKPSGSTQAGSPCQARFTYSGSWNAQWPTTALNIYVKNLGTTKVDYGWTFTMYNPNYKGQSSTWNFQLVGFSAQTFTGVANANWEALQVGGQEVNIGMVLSSASASFVPMSFKVNGVACSIV